MPPKALTFKPSQAVRFGRTNDGGAIGELVATNPTDAYVAYKVKTNAAERYIVRPHIGIIAPRQTASITIAVKPSFMEDFLAVVREQRNSKPQTAFLVMEWQLSAETWATVASRVAEMGGDAVETAEGNGGSHGKRQATADALSRIWKDAEPTYKGSMLSNKFSLMMEEATLHEDAEDALNTTGSTTAAEGTRNTPQSQSLGQFRSASAGQDAMMRTAAPTFGAGRPTEGSGGSADTPSAPLFSPDAPAGTAGSKLRPVDPASGSRGQEDEEEDVPADVRPPTPVGVHHGRPAKRSSDANGAASTGASAAGGGSLAVAPAMSEAEARALRTRVTELERIGLDTIRDRQVMAKAIEAKEAQLQQALATIATLEESAAAAKTVTGGVRLRRAAEASSGGTETATDDEDDSTVKGGEPGGFPLWQLLLVAVLMFLIGRLSVAYA